jgi:hypothetical protein
MFVIFFIFQVFILTFSIFKALVFIAFTLFFYIPKILLFIILFSYVNFPTLFSTITWLFKPTAVSKLMPPSSSSPLATFPVFPSIVFLPSISFPFKFSNLPISFFTSPIPSQLYTVIHILFSILSNFPSPPK